MWFFLILAASSSTQERKERAEPKQAIWTTVVLLNKPDVAHVDPPPHPALQETLVGLNDVGVEVDLKEWRAHRGGWKQKARELLGLRTAPSTKLAYSVSFVGCMKASGVHHLCPSVCFTVTPLRDRFYICYPLHDEAYQRVRLQALESQHFLVFIDCFAHWYPHADWLSCIQSLRYWFLPLEMDDHLRRQGNKRRKLWILLQHDVSDFRVSVHITFIACIFLWDLLFKKKKSY